MAKKPIHQTAYEQEVASKKKNKVNKRSKISNTAEARRESNAAKAEKEAVKSRKSDAARRAASQAKTDAPAKKVKKTSTPTKKITTPKKVTAPKVKASKTGGFGKMGLAGMVLGAGIYAYEQVKAATRKPKNLPAVNDGQTSSIAPFELPSKTAKPVKTDKRSVRDARIAKRLASVTPTGGKDASLNKEGQSARAVTSAKNDKAKTSAKSVLAEVHGRDKIKSKPKASFAPEVATRKPKLNSNESGTKADPHSQVAKPKDIGPKRGLAKKKAKVRKKQGQVVSKSGTFKKDK